MVERVHDGFSNRMISLGTFPIYDINPGWTALSKRKIHAPIILAIDHLSRWFTSADWHNERLYFHTEETQNWTTLAFIFTPEGRSKYARLACDLNPLSNVSDLRYFVRFPENEIREDGGLYWYETTPIRDRLRQVAIHPKKLGIITGYHGTHLRDDLIQNINPQKGAFIKNLTIPHVVSWVEFSPLHVVKRKRREYGLSGYEEKRGLEDRTKVAFEVSIANVKPMIRDEINIRQTKPQLRENNTDTTLLEDILNNFKNQSDLLV